MVCLSFLYVQLVHIVMKTWFADKGVNKERVLSM
jgi:hypothetical protein